MSDFAMLMAIAGILALAGGALVLHHDTALAGQALAALAGWLSHGNKAQS